MKKYAILSLIVLTIAYLLYERNLHNLVSYRELLKVRKTLHRLTSQEKKDLAFFINDIITFDQYPYTLCGYKPMSICSVMVEDSEETLPTFRETFKKPKYQTLRRGYLVWEKYQSLFPRKKYILLHYPFFTKGKLEMAVICPNLCLATIQEHLDDFQEILEKPYTTEEIFSILTHPEHPDFYTIIDRTKLIGILLGFGKNNATLYEQYRAGVSRSNTQGRSGHKSLKMFTEELPWPGVKLSPNFACDPTTKETRQLRKRYKKGAKIIRWTYLFRDSLEVTLALLMQEA